MDFLGIGPLEILFILIIALIVLGPKDMAKAGKTIGQSLRKIVMSPHWRAIQQTSREMRNLPNRLIREAGMEDISKEIPDLKKTGNEITSLLRNPTILPTPIDDYLDPSTQVENPSNQNISPISDQKLASNDLSSWITPPQTSKPSDSKPG